ncbi:MAG: hypothetical protein OXC63_08450 [Aestuariivita sp.]|nr:hypothetical protein [Aestuariivita sp.]MCY4345422.1 hypothetical protein [Aestuariivita sp.]
MILDVSVDDLPGNPEKAFCEFETKVRTAYENQEAANSYDDMGNFVSEVCYASRKSYVVRILAFLDLRAITYADEPRIRDITTLDGEDFMETFGQFTLGVERLITTFQLRNDSQTGTKIAIAISYKAEIGRYLKKIREIVRREVKAVHKRDNIFAKIAALQSEVDRDQTTIDAAFGRVIDLSKVIGEVAENIKPVIELMDKIKRIFWEGTDKVNLLPKPPSPIMLPKPNSNAPSKDASDDIPVDEGS